MIRKGHFDSLEFDSVSRAFEATRSITDKINKLTLPIADVVDRASQATKINYPKLPELPDFDSILGSFKATHSIANETDRLIDVVDKASRVTRINFPRVLGSEELLKNLGAEINFPQPSSLDEPEPMMIEPINFEQCRNEVLEQSIELLIEKLKAARLLNNNVWNIKSTGNHNQIGDFHESTFLSISENDAKASIELIKLVSSDPEKATLIRSTIDELMKDPKNTSKLVLEELFKRFISKLYG